MEKSAETGDKILTPHAAAEKVRETAGHALQASKERALSMERQVEDYVVERPIQSVLIAAGVGAGLGLALGVLLGRR